MNASRLVLIVSALSVLPMLSGIAIAQTATSLVCTGCVNSEDIADGTVKSNDLSNNAVTTTKIKNNTVSFNKLSTGVRNSLDTAFAGMTVERVYATADSIVGAECPVDTTAVSANCACSDGGGANNYGFVGLCASFDVGSIAACLSDGALFDPNLPEPVAEVEAVCVGGTTTNGTPWSPVPIIPALNAETDDADARLIEWRKRQYQAYEAAMTDARNEAAIRRSRLVER